MCNTLIISKASTVPVLESESARKCQSHLRYWKNICHCYV